MSCHERRHNTQVPVRISTVFMMPSCSGQRGAHPSRSHSCLRRGRRGSGEIQNVSGIMHVFALLPFICKMIDLVENKAMEKVGERMLGKYKEYGVVYTPEWIVDLILDKTMAGYQPSMRVCDPACGDGAFLAGLVARICDTLPAKDCRKALENISGMDIDPRALAQCSSRLNGVLAARGKRLKIKWNLHCIDATNRKLIAPFEGCFDYVVGNPPYVRIQHLGAARRRRLQKDWALARRGSTDLYIAFFEIGMFLLKQDGRLGYITPNTYAKTSAGQELRRFMLMEHAIHCLVDFGAHQLFKDATTYSLITLLNKNRKSKKFSLYRYDGNKLLPQGKVSISRLSLTGIWTLEPEPILSRIEEIRNRGWPLKEIADIHVGIQTLADKVFILEKKEEKSRRVVAHDMHGAEVHIEAAITKPILKASVMKDGKDVKERIIIFPYVDGKLMAEKLLMNKYPLAYQYLKKHKKILLGRDKGEFDASRWYAFGRDCGLTTSFGNKILTSGMNKKPNFQKCPAKKYTFYSGYCVKPKAGVDIDDLILKLNSEDMNFYIGHTSRDYQKGWKSYAKSFIQDYGVPLTG